MTCLPVGNGHSYGDSCLNDGGVLLDVRGLDRFIAFDSAAGRLRCEAGVQLGDILELTVPAGWFLPTTPGTRHVTVGGAIANDVHGKNHHRAGSFGCHLRGFELARSDGQILRCSSEEHPDWFAATIGGLGLTGLIRWADIQLRRVDGPVMSVATRPCQDLDDALALAEASDREFEYTAIWLDGLARGRALGRGVAICANHADVDIERAPGPPRGLLAVPSLPLGLVIRPGVALFNHAYRLRHRQPRTALAHYERVLYPLDGIRHWNRLYGPSGFVQHQSVLGAEGVTAAVRELLERAAAAGGSTLAVLKRFGAEPARGLLSFARPGVTLALDFPFRGARTRTLLAELDEVVATAGGAVNPAKDAHMRPAHFRRFFPQWEELESYRDPRFSSSFWRRVTAHDAE